MHFGHRAIVAALVLASLAAARQSAIQRGPDRSAIAGASAATRPAIASSPLTAGDHVRRFDLDGRKRSYIVHIPPKLRPDQPAPVVLIFHGAFMNAREMVRFCGMNRKSDQAGFVAVYPNGTGIGEAVLTFNAWFAPTPGPKGMPDDVDFTARILDDLLTVMKADPKRIYATGMSNGGFMCYRLASELSDRIAAIAPVAGTSGMPRSNPKRSVSVMHFHGRADTMVPFAGPKGRVPRLLLFRSVDDTIREWVKLNGCPEMPKVSELPDVVADGTSVKRYAYGPGTDGAEVILFAIEGGGHTWPGQQPPVRLLGKSTEDISANDLIWEFFQRHPMK